VILTKKEERYMDRRIHGFARNKYTTVSVFKLNFEIIHADNAIMQPPSHAAFSFPDLSTLHVESDRCQRMCVEVG
jgi:hypothetical protein